MTAQTSLFLTHTELKAKIVPFSGWMMPVSYSTVLTEHKAVRESCGIFDVSHMGELFVSGEDSLSYLQKLTINDASKLVIGKGQYTAILNPDGGMIDDLILYRIGEQEFLICMNASNIAKDTAWFFKHTENFKVSVKDESEFWSQIAVQGPKATSVMGKIFGTDLVHTEYMSIVQRNYHEKRTWIARTGYTGESGFEIYLPNDLAPLLWKQILATDGAVKPCGLGARDTLRLEACYLLYGNDMNESVSPLEAGIGWATKLTKNDFIGKDALVAQKTQGVKRQIFAFKMHDDGIPRHGMKVFNNAQEIGEVTSGSVLPTLGGSGGMALLNSNGITEGTHVEIDIRGIRKKAIICKRPLYVAKTKNF